MVEPRVWAKWDCFHNIRSCWKKNNLLPDSVLPLGCLADSSILVPIRLYVMTIKYNKETQWMFQMMRYYHYFPFLGGLQVSFMLYNFQPPGTASSLLKMNVQLSATIFGVYAPVFLVPANESWQSSRISSPCPSSPSSVFIIVFVLHFGSARIN